MQTQLEKNTAEIFVKMALDAWKKENEKADKLLEEISDEQLNSEVVEGKNTGYYLFGHIVAVNDNLFQILDLGDRSHAELEEIFLRNPDNKGEKTYSIEELKKFWKEINAKLNEKFENFSADDWFAKHASVSAENFEKEPHRNRLNVLLSRTIHQSYHLGQISLLKK